MGEKLPLFYKKGKSVIVPDLPFYCIGIYASKSQVERYLSPVSGSKATMRLPANSGFWASSNAA